MHGSGRLERTNATALLAPSGKPGAWRRKATVVWLGLTHGHVRAHFFVRHRRFDAFPPSSLESGLDLRGLLSPCLRMCLSRLQQLGCIKGQHLFPPPLFGCRVRISGCHSLEQARKGHPGTKACSHCTLCSCACSADGGWAPGETDGLLLPCAAPASNPHAWSQQLQTWAGAACSLRARPCHLARPHWMAAMPGRR